MKVDCTHTRCPSLDECSSANPACKDKELTSVVFIFDQMWACSHSRRMSQVEDMSYDGTKCATRKHIQIGRSVCLCFSFSISVSFPQTFIARREGGEEVVLSL